MSAQIWVVIPAAGSGRRMASDIPKQYLQLVNRTVIEWSVEPFLASANVERVIVALASDDIRFASLSIAKNPRVQTTAGGMERTNSVLQGLRALQANEEDWVLVHDAARPCLSAADLSRLIDEVADDDVGGLLAVPVADTLKSADASLRVSVTVPRERLWRAQTPQMFRYGLLVRALQSAAEANFAVTDEAAAVERLGLKPKLVAGRADNIKITVPEDLAYAEFILSTRITEG